MMNKRWKTHSAVSQKTGVFLALSMTLSPVALAGDGVSAEEITAAVSDSTYQGSMTKSDSAFAEYYQPDGTIAGKGYSGKWRVEDNTMCFQYGDNPENCWEIELNGSAMTLVKEGKADGSGMLIEGNPHDF